MTLCKESEFISLSDDRVTGVLSRDKALEIIKNKKLTRVKLGSFNSAGILYFTLSLPYEWAWNTEMIRRELNSFGIALIRDELQFYTATIGPYPLFILKQGFDKAICVSPTLFEEEEWFSFTPKNSS